MRTTILLDHGPCPGGHVVRAMLKLAGDAPAAAHRAPLNLSLVLDRSGSMSGEKLDELEGLLGIAAQNVRVEVCVAPDVVLARVHHQYPSAQQAGVLCCCSRPRACGATRRTWRPPRNCTPRAT